MVLQEYSGGPAVHLRGGERPRKTPVTHLSQAPLPSRRLGPFGRPSSVVRDADAQNRKMTRIYSTSDRSLEGGVRPLVLRLEGGGMLRFALWANPLYRQPDI